MPSSVYTKRQEIRPAQLRAVADGRFDDAQALASTGDNARANGTQYLAGIVIDILLKAQLMRQYPVTARKRQHEVTALERPVWSLIWRSHDLGEMLAHLPGLTIALRKSGDRAGRPYREWLRGICGVWTVYVR